MIHSPPSPGRVGAGDEVPLEEVLRDRGPLALQAPRLRGGEAPKDTIE